MNDTTYDGQLVMTKIQLTDQMICGIALGQERYRGRLCQVYKYLGDNIR
jgi:hypothetical protein